MGLRLPKIFKNGMVLQADPPSKSGKEYAVETIWGFMDGVRTNVTLMGRCQLYNADPFEIKDVYYSVSIQFTIQ